MDSTGPGILAAEAVARGPVAFFLKALCAAADLLSGLPGCEFRGAPSWRSCAFRQSARISVMETMSARGTIPALVVGVGDLPPWRG